MPRKSEITGGHEDAFDGGLELDPQYGDPTVIRRANDIISDLEDYFEPDIYLGGPARRPVMLGSALSGLARKQHNEDERQKIVRFVGSMLQIERKFVDLFAKGDENALTNMQQLVDELLERNPAI